jgi:hypothetical protein
LNSIDELGRRDDKRKEGEAYVRKLSSCTIGVPVVLVERYPTMYSKRT